MCVRFGRGIYQTHPPVGGRPTTVATCHYQACRPVSPCRRLAVSTCPVNLSPCRLFASGRVVRSPGHRVIWSSGHLVTSSSGHLVTGSSVHVFASSQLLRFAPIFCAFLFPLFTRSKLYPLREMSVLISTVLKLAFWFGKFNETLKKRQGFSFI